jgi:nucleotide-binding universal stress UspA family protein
LYRKMLVPLDGSTLAEETFPYARELAGRLNIDLDFLYVSRPTDPLLMAMGKNYVENVARTVGEQLKHTRNGDVGQSPEVQVKYAAVTGYPAEEILKYAEQNNIDIILMATHRASGVRRWALGSVAYQVLHASKVPVWLVRSGIPTEVVYDKWPQRSLLLPLDGSKTAEIAIPHAMAIAEQRGKQAIEVILLSVYAPRNYSGIYFSAEQVMVPVDYPEIVKEEARQAKERCDQYLKSVAEQFTARGIKVRTEAIMGDPADEIINYANKNPFQLIVMASHGRSGISHLALGSVAEKVLLDIHIPLLLVTPGAAKSGKN